MIASKMKSTARFLPRFRPVLAGLISTVWVCCVMAAEPAPLSGMRQALDAAWARQPQAQAWVERQNAAQAQLDAARSVTPGPSSLSVSQLQDKLNQNRGQQEWELEWATPLWLPGQRAAQTSEAEQQVTSTHSQALALRWQLAGEVRQAWWAAASAQTAWTLAKQKVETAHALAQTVTRRVQAGDLARLDGNLAQAEWLSAQVDELTARQSATQTQQALEALTGLTVHPSTEPEALLDRTQPDLTQHPSLMAHSSALQVAQSRLSVLQKSQRGAPELALRWNSQRGDRHEPYAQAVGVKLTVPLSSTPLVNRDQALARAELAQADAELAQAATRIQMAIQQAQQELDSAAQQLQLAQQRQALTQDNLQLAQRAFDLGEADLPTLLRARAAAYDAQSATQQQTIALAAAHSRVLQAQGVLP